MMLPALLGWSAGWLNMGGYYYYTLVACCICLVMHYNQDKPFYLYVLFRRRS
jgi:hypothetical protein